MQIIHKIDEFLYEIFPTLKRGDERSLKEAIQAYYTYGPTIPKVSIEDGLIKVEIDIPTIISQDRGLSSEPLPLKFED
jgi:hypothetical protein